MGIWVELGIFGLALAFGIWQIRDVAKARAQSEAQRRRDAPPATEGKANQPGSDGSDH